MFSANMVRQYSFLNQLMSDLENDPSKVCKRIIGKAPRSGNNAPRISLYIQYECNVQKYILHFIPVLKSCEKLSPNFACDTQKLNI